MKAKTWYITFLSIIIICLLFIVSMNYIVDPFGYFRAKSGDTKDQYDAYYMREIKARHILKSYDKYDAYLIAGSKAGALPTQKLKELDGYNYYNNWVLSGNFQDYYYNTKFIIEHARPKKILLHISTTEFKQYDREMKGDLYEIPAIVKGSGEIFETFKFLFKNLSKSTEELSTDRPEITRNFLTGERNLEKYYVAQNNNAEGFVKSWLDPALPTALKYLEKGSDTKIGSIMDRCLEDIKNIKKMCDKNNIEFQIVIAPVFISEQLRYEGKDLYNFITNLALITDGFWCFSKINRYNLNPYNFYNTNHYFYESGELMIDVMSNKVNDTEFGTFVTPDNVAAYINERKQSYESIRNYTIENNALPLESYNDKSMINRESKEQMTVTSSYLRHQ